MSNSAALAALIPLVGALGLDVASLATSVANNIGLAVPTRTATSFTITSTEAVTAASTTVAAATAASFRVLVAAPISTGVRSLSPIRLSLGVMTLT